MRNSHLFSDTVEEPIRHHEQIAPPETEDDQICDAEALECRYLGKVIRHEAIRLLPEVGRVSVDVPRSVLTDDREIPTGGSLWLTCTPLSGIQNHLLHFNSSALPYGVCLTLLDRVKGPHFSEILACVIADYTSDKLWLSWRRLEDLTYDSVLSLNRGSSGQSIAVQPQTRLDPEKQKLIHNFSKYEQLPGQLLQHWLHRNDSIIDIASIVGGSVNAVCFKEQSHSVVGAGYALLHGAGGIVTTFKNQDLIDLPYSWWRPTLPQAVGPPALSTLDVAFSCGGGVFHAQLLEILAKL